MADAAERSWVWRSTEESRAARKISVVAVFETIVCVALYWVLMLWLGVTWHHWMILIATPLVLFRSEQSVALGIKWFDVFLDSSEEIPLRSSKGIAAVVTSFLTAGLAYWFLDSNWLIGSTGWILFLKSAALGYVTLNLGVAVVIAAMGPGAFWVAMVGAGPFAVSVAGAGAMILAGEFVGLAIILVLIAVVTVGNIIVAVAFKEILSLLLAVTQVGVGLGFWLRATLVRFTANLRFLLSGAIQFPANWRYSTTVSDLFHPPELIPGNKAFVYGNVFTFSLKHLDGKWKDQHEVIANLILTPIFFGPALLWRWAVKSTAWFYLPLLWVRRGWQRLDGEDLEIWAKSYSSKVLNWFWLMLGLVSIAAVTVTLFSLQKYVALQENLNEAGAPLTALGILYALERSELPKLPWLWFYLPSYALTFFIFLGLDNIAKDIRHGAAPAAKYGIMQKWMWAANARAVLTNIGLAVALWYFLDAVDAWKQFTTVVEALTAPWQPSGG